MKRSGPPERRTPLQATVGLRRGRGLRRQRRVNPVSDRRRRRDTSYQAARQQAADRARGRCEARAAPGCTGRCEQVHHVAGRGGDDPHRLDNLLAVCAACHRHIHSHVTESYERGWMRRRTTSDG